MSNLEEENHMLREQVAGMQTEIEKLTGMMTTLLANQNQIPTPEPQPSNTPVPPVSSVPLSTPQFVMPEGYPWGMPTGFLGEGSRLVTSEIPYTAQPAAPVLQLNNTLPQTTVTVPAPFVHVNPQDQIPVFHTESIEGGDRIDDLHIKYEEIQKEVKALKELKALRGKDLFGQDAHDLCLVPDVVVPKKFKVPDFEKYKGSTCPRAHLTMYARRMSTQTSNDQLLIHYFQDSLTGAALRWYMDLDRESVSSFNDLAGAFIKQYDYNSYMAPDRDELRALAQEDKESFKEYAQRWRELAAQIRPPLEEKELCKLFLHTLSPFFYEKMVGVVSRSFTEMVEMGMCLEEGVRQGRLTRESTPANAAKRYDNSFTKKKESEVSMVARGGSQSRHPTYQKASAITPTYQPQLPQPKIQQQSRQRGSSTFDPIPMTYADLLPSLLQRNLVQTRSPPAVPKDLPPWYKADVYCAFHQGAPGHSIENCYPLMIEVQKLVKSGFLSFKDVNPNI